MKNDGGPAFSDGRVFKDWVPNPGMSLRDAFALSALPALLSDAAISRVSRKSPESLAARIAIEAYLMADAMITEREK